MSAVPADAYAPLPLRAVSADGGFVTRSTAVAALLDQARRAAASKAAVLIEGESGTGKELVARLIHDASPRRRRPFVRVNCAALSESLVESELFGHEKGAFTGAEQGHAGRFERAHGGSLLLDEIGEMPVKLQPKLLRVLEEEEFERVGGTRVLPADVRVIATTNRDLARAIRQGLFRQDLFYRLSAIHLRLPPLRSRPADVPALAEHFIARFRSEGAAAVTGIEPRALELLSAYSWPGNVRQLRNVIHHACVLARRPQIAVHDLPPLPDAPTPDADHGDRPVTLEEAERRLILETLRAVGGNKTAAAQRLGVTARTLFNKLKRYGQAGDGN